MPKENSVYLYRNGIADFQRVYPVAAGGQSISIPVKADDVGDILASLQIFGAVKLTKPPGYAPKDKNSTLVIDAKQPLTSILTSFSGSRARLVLKSNNEDVTGTLVGCETVNEVAHNGVSGPVKYVGILTDTGLRQYKVTDDIRSVELLTDADRTELQKALARNYQKIKPDSTFIDLALKPTGDAETEAILQYALPVASWNMSYRLKRDENGKWTLEGHAVVHNSTDFDWQKYWISVVTGEPNTFSHDLADAKKPRRSHVNVTADRVQGAVDIEEGMMLSAAPQAAGRGVAKSRGLQMASMGAHSHAMSFAAEGGGGGADYESVYAQADMDMAEASTVGDFLILKSPNPADIPANQSALVPMFQKELKEAERVFYYKPQNNASFPFSSIKFKNTTDMPLVKGVVTVMIEGHNAGESILESCKPGDVRLLAHTLETGVKVNKETAKIDQTIILVRLNEGNVYTETRQTSKQTYTIKNKLKEDGKILIEHNWNVTDADVTISIGDERVDKTEKLSNGIRFTVPIKAEETVSVFVTETKLVKASYGLDAGHLTWVIHEGYFKNEGDFAKVSKIQEEISTLTTRKNELTAELRQAIENQNRHNNMLPNATANKDQFESLVSKAETQIQDIQGTKLPQIEEQIKAKQAEFRQALKNLKQTWTPQAAKAEA